MALRRLRLEGDSILRKSSKHVEIVDDKIRQLVDDLFETMYSQDGAGLAAVQVGILRRIFVVDITEEKNEPYAFINPEIISREGEQTVREGCLSMPNVSGVVRRPGVLIIKALNRQGEEFEMRMDGNLAVAVEHELDHLDGILYTDKVLGSLQYEPDEEQRPAKKKRKKV